jgi:hypothetical protein
VAAVVLAGDSVAVAFVGLAVKVSMGVDSAVGASIEGVDMSPVHGAAPLLKVPAVVLLLKAQGQLALPEGRMPVQPSGDQMGASMLEAPKVVRM